VAFVVDGLIKKALAFPLFSNQNPIVSLFFPVLKLLAGPPTLASTRHRQALLGQKGVFSSIMDKQTNEYWWYFHKKIFKPTSIIHWASLWKIVCSRGCLFAFFLSRSLHHFVRLMACFMPFMEISFAKQHSIAAAAAEEFRRQSTSKVSWGKFMYPNGKERIMPLLILFFCFYIYKYRWGHSTDDGLRWNLCEVYLEKQRREKNI
jgi:hypothetical protein